MKLYTSELYVYKTTTFELQWKGLSLIPEVISAVKKHPVFLTRNECKVWEAKLNFSIIIPCNYRIIIFECCCFINGTILYIFFIFCFLCVPGWLDVTYLTASRQETEKQQPEIRVLSKTSSLHTEPSRFIHCAVTPPTGMNKDCHRIYSMEKLALHPSRRVPRGPQGPN